MLRHLLPAAGLATLLAASTALAQTGPTVTIRSAGGSAVTGELVEIDGTYYKLRTSLGVIDIDMTDATCIGEGCPKPDTLEKIAIAGSPAIGAELMPALVLGYADSLKAQIAYETGASEGAQVLRLVDDAGADLAVIALSEGSDSSFAELADKTAAIGMASREVSAEEVATLAAAGTPDPRGTEREHWIASDAVAVLVHPDNPLASISLGDLAAVFSGEVTSWASLGGPDLPVKLYAQDDRSRAVEVFEELVLGPAGKQLAGAIERSESSRELADLLAVEPGAIALAGLSYMGGATALPIRQSCGLVTPASEFTVKAGEYPLSRRLYLYEQPDVLAGHARSLLDFAMSDAAQPVIAAAHLVDRSFDYTALGTMGAQFAHTWGSGAEVPAQPFHDLVAELGNARRLSATLRFQPGSDDLDAGSRRDLAALAQQIGQGVYQGHDLLLVGFSDAEGGFDAQLARSQVQAARALDDLTGTIGAKAAADAGLKALAYGGLLPVACNDDAEGSALNRRIEIWVRPKGA